MMSRRRIFLGSLGGLLAEPDFARSQAQGAAADLQENWRQFLSPNARVPESEESLRFSDGTWRNRLSVEAYRVLREEFTEERFSSILNVEHRAGVYVCVACDLPLFTSAMKYDSGTGWPSFFTTVPGGFEKSRSVLSWFFGVEYHCVRCGGHHGHLFDDGPAPTGERWCNNGVALKFIPRDS